MLYSIQDMSVHSKEKWPQNQQLKQTTVKFLRRDNEISTTEVPAFSSLS